MRRMHRIVLLFGLVALTPVLSACADFDMDKLDVFGLNEKAKLPGERRAVFPQGVPGVSQGIPPEYIKGNQPPENAQTLPVEPAAAGKPAKKNAAVQSADEPKPKPKRRPKPPQPAQPAAQQDQQAPQTAQSPNQGMAPWPSSPAPGTFSR